MGDFYVIPVKLISFSFKICVCAFFVVPLHAEIGKLSEWSKEPHSKCGIRVSVSRVRIPHFPQYKKKSVCPSLLEQADFFLYCKDAVGRLWDYVEIPPVCPSLLEQADFFLYCKDAVSRLLAARGVGEQQVFSILPP